MKNSFYIMFFIILVSLSVQADELTVAAEDFAPFGYEDKNGKIVGISTEIVEHLLKDTGIKGNIDLYPWARAYEMALTQKNVLLYTVIKNKEKIGKGTM